MSTLKSELRVGVRFVFEGNDANTLERLALSFTEQNFRKGRVIVFGEDTERLTQELKWYGVSRVVSLSKPSLYSLRSNLTHNCDAVLFNRPLSRNASDLYKFDSSFKEAVDIYFGKDKHSDVFRKYKFFREVVDICEKPIIFIGEYLHEKLNEDKIGNHVKVVLKNGLEVSDNKILVLNVENGSTYTLGVF